MAVSADCGQPAQRRHAAQALYGRMDPVGEQVAAFLHWNRGESLLWARPVGRCQLGKVSGQPRQPHAISHPPQEPRLAGFLDRGGTRLGQRQPPSRRQFRASLEEPLPAPRHPVPRFLQPLPKHDWRDTGEFHLRARPAVSCSKYPHPKVQRSNRNR